MFEGITKRRKNPVYNIAGWALLILVCIIFMFVGYSPDVDFMGSTTSIADVNGEIISYNDFNRHYERLQESRQGAKLNEQERQSMQNRAVNDLVDRSLIIQEAKNGNFEKQSDGSILVAGKYPLSAEEMEIAYLGKEGADVEAEGGVLVALDTSITPELEREGLARDLVRQIQELRKAADYKVDDRIQVALIGVDPKVLSEFGDYIQNETLATSLENDMIEPDQFGEFEGMVIKVKKG